MGCLERGDGRVMSLPIVLSTLTALVVSTSVCSSVRKCNEPRASVFTRAPGAHTGQRHMQQAPCLSSNAEPTDWRALFRDIGLSGLEQVGTVSDDVWRRYYIEKGYRCVLPNGVSYVDTLASNIAYWKMAGEGAPGGRDDSMHRRPIFAEYLARIQTLLASKGHAFSIEEFKTKIVGEICAGPWGGIIEALGVSAALKVQIDLFATELRDLQYSTFNNTVFVPSPAEHIALETDSLDLLLGFNSLDHGWSIEHSLFECMRVSRQVHVSFDTRGVLNLPYHYQLITPQRVQAAMKRVCDPAKTGAVYHYCFVSWENPHQSAEVFIKRDAFSSSKFGTFHRLESLS